MFTKSIETTNTLTRALRVGTTWVNCFDIFDVGIHFGGYKMSGTRVEKVAIHLKLLRRIQGSWMELLQKVKLS